MTDIINKILHQLAVFTLGFAIFIGVYVSSKIIDVTFGEMLMGFLCFLFAENIIGRVKS